MQSIYHYFSNSNLIDLFILGQTGPDNWTPDQLSERAARLKCELEDAFPTSESRALAKQMNEHVYYLLKNKADGIASARAMVQEATADLAFDLGPWTEDFVIDLLCGLQTAFVLLIDTVCRKKAALVLSMTQYNSGFIRLYGFEEDIPTFQLITDSGRVTTYSYVPFQSLSTIALGNTQSCAFWKKFLEDGLDAIIGLSQSDLINLEHCRVYYAPEGKIKSSDTS